MIFNTKHNNKTFYLTDFCTKSERTLDGLDNIIVRYENLKLKALDNIAFSAVFKKFFLFDFERHNKFVSANCPRKEVKILPF